MDSTPAGDPNLPSWLDNSYAAYFQLTHSLPHIQKSIASCAQANGVPSVHLIAARNAALQSSMVALAAWFTLLLPSVFSQVAGLGQIVHHHYTNICGHSGLVQSAVAFALHYDRPNLALEWLEQGQCLVWNQLNQLYTPIDNLCTMSLSLADHFVKVASALESYGTHRSSTLSPDST